MSARQGRAIRTTLHRPMAPTDDAPTLEGTTWHLTRGVAIPEGTTISARFVGGTVSGHAGINRYRADYRTHGDVIELGPAAATLMAGEPAAMKAEHDFLQLLGAADHVGFEGATLVLSDVDRRQLLWFEAGPPIGDQLVGRWVVTGIRRGDAIVSPTAGSDASLEFDGQGVVSGSTGVNRLDGPARADGDRLHIGPLRTTRMAGPPEAMDDEAAFVAALEDVAAFGIEAGALTLLDADGGTRVTLARG